MGMTNEQKEQLAARFMVQGLEEHQAKRAAEMSCAFRAVKLLVPMSDDAAVLFAMAAIR